MLLGLVLGWIPGIGAAGATYFLLKWLLFRSGEIENFEATRRVEAAQKLASAKATNESAPPQESRGRRFED